MKSEPPDYLPAERIRPERPAQPKPLTANEVTRIVDLVVAYTRREPDATMVQVWAAQSVIGRWTCAEAEAAIHLWASRREPGDFLEPGDVTRTIRAQRQDHAMRAEQARNEATPANPAAAERIREIVGGLAQRMGWHDEDTPRGPGASLAVACPHCHAAVGSRCQSGGKPLRKAACHPSRSDALAAQLKRGA